MEEAYRQARKRGEQGRRHAISQSEHPYLTDLDSLVAQLPLGQRESVGLRDIPLEMVVGTVTKGRQSAFSCNFMPLLPFNTEFARKWSNLYDIQVTEGYRDPIIVTEFMHRFYVQEGNKRVSVLKFLDAPTVSAKVTRLYPSKWESVESRLYGEFCAFWRVCPLYEIEFSREGSYETLAKMLGQNLIEKWPQKKIDYLRHTFLLFKRAYLRAGGDIQAMDTRNGLRLCQIPKRRWNIGGVVLTQQNTAHGALRQQGLARQAARKFLGTKAIVLTRIHIYPAIPRR